MQSRRRREKIINTHKRIERWWDEDEISSDGGDGEDQ